MTFEFITPSSVEPAIPSRYLTGHIDAAKDVALRVTYDRAVDFVGKVDIWDSDNPDADARGFVGSKCVTERGSMRYDFTYAVPDARGEFNVHVPTIVYDTDANTYAVYDPATHGMGQREYTAYRFDYGAPPSFIEITAKKPFIRNGETVSVYFQMILREPLSLVQLSVSAGTLSNFRGNDHTYSYAVDITAPETGSGAIALNISGYSSLSATILYASEPTNDIFFAGMLNEPPHLGNFDDGTLYVREVMEGDLDNINDFKVMIVFGSNVNELTKTDIDLEAMDDAGDMQAVSIEDFKGENSAYEATIRPPTGGGSGMIVIEVPEDVVADGNSGMSLTLQYSDEIYEPDWYRLFQTPETYNDIVSVSRGGVQLLRESQIDFFNFDGDIDANQQVVLPGSITVTRAVKYEVGKYLGLATASDSKSHLFFEGATGWSSESVWTLATNRADAASSEIRGLAVFDWVWTRDRSIVLVSMPFMNAPARLARVHSFEIHKAIRENINLNDIAFDNFSVDYGDVDFDQWRALVAIAHSENKLFVASNETGSNQNYVFVFDEEDMLLSHQRIPIGFRVKSLFAKNGWLYAYNDTNREMCRFPLQLLHKPLPRQKVYPLILSPGDAVDLTKLVRYADHVVADIGFDKPEWVSIEDNELKVAEDAAPKSTAYISLRGLNHNGASDSGVFGFYIYIDQHRSPNWKDFDALSMYSNQELNLFKFVDDADEIEWQYDWMPPGTLLLENGILKPSGAVAAPPGSPIGISIASQDTALFVTWQIPQVYPALSRQEIRYAESIAGLASAPWTDIGSKTARSHTLTNLVNGRTYYVQVRLTNSEGVGEPNTPVSEVPNLVSAVPSVPTGVTVTGENRSAVARWTLPYAFPALSDQQIRWADSLKALETATWTDLTATATNYRITPLVNGEAVYVQLRGVNSEGNGAVSAAVSATPLGVPESPTGVTATGDNMVVSVAWTIGAAFPALSKQQIRWATSTAALASATWTDIAASATSYDITGLTNGEAVYVQVRGVNSEGNSAVSDTVSATPVGASGPSVVRNIRTSANVDFRGRVWAAFQWDAPESLGRSTSGTPTLVRYEYRTTRATGSYQSNGAWRSVNTALTTRQIGFTYSDGAPTIEIRAINNNTPPDNEGEILTVTYQNGSWS